MKQLRLLLVFLKAYIQSYAEYRLGALIWIINGSIGRLMSMFIWLIISSQKTLALNSGQIATYFFLSIIVTRLTQVWSMEQIGDLIKDGELSQVLLKPYSLLIDNLADQIGQKSTRIIALVPVMLVLAYPLRSQLNFNFQPWRIILFLLAVFMGFSMLFVLDNALGLFAFWMEDIHGLSRINDTLNGFFGGNIIPLAFMPGMFRSVMTYYPARFGLSFPLEILVANAPTSVILEGFIICSSWLVFFVILRTYLYHQGIKKYSAIGG